MNLQINPKVDRTEDAGLTDRLPGRKYLIGGAALVLALGGFWYFTHAGTDTSASRRNLAVPVKVAAVTRREMAVTEHTIGTVIANSTVQVTARVTGQLVAAHFKEGQFVKTGDLLFQIDPRPYQAALNQALATEAHDQAQLENAQRDARRYSALFAQNAISVQQRDLAQANAQALEASVQSDRAAVQVARLNLDYTRIRATMNGKTGAILVQPGNMVTASSSVSASSLVTINEVQPVKISFALPQSDLPRIQARQRSKGLVASIHLENSAGKARSAPVDFIGNAVNNTTGTIELRATFPNADLSLVPGQLVDVGVELNSIPNALIVPHDAINEGPDGQQYVYAIHDGKALLKPVTVLFDDTKNVAVTGQLTPGEQVVIDGQLRIVPGAGVFVEGHRQRRGAGAGGGAGEAGTSSAGRRRVGSAL